MGKPLRTLDSFQGTHDQADLQVLRQDLEKLEARILALETLLEAQRHALEYQRQRALKRAAPPAGQLGVLNGLGLPKLF